MKLESQITEEELEAARSDSPRSILRDLRLANHMATHGRIASYMGTSYGYLGHLIDSSMTQAKASKLADAIEAYAPDRTDLVRRLAAWWEMSQSVVRETRADGKRIVMPLKTKPLLPTKSVMDEPYDPTTSPFYGLNLSATEIIDIVNRAKKERLNRQQICAIAQEVAAQHVDQERQ